MAVEPAIKDENVSGKQVVNRIQAINEKKSTKNKMAEIEEMMKSMKNMK